MKISAVFLLLLSSVVFAQVDDIGRTLFVELLGVREYPGAPFSGNPVNDIILFFLLPTILIIMIIYMMVGRIFPAGYRSLRLLLGIGAYLFIVAGGYFAFFIRLTGPTFIFFVFILGVLFFFLEFITGRGRGGGAGGGGGGGGGPRVAEAQGISEHDKIMAYLGMPRLHGPEANFLKQKAKILWQGIKAAESGKGPTHSDPLSARQILGEIEIKVFRKVLSDQERGHRYH